LPIIRVMTHHHALYRPAQVAELDRLAIEGQGVAGYELMNRAGTRAFATLMARWPEARAITVCCGGGNNGGDGYVVARLALERGLGVQLIALKRPEELSGDAARAARDWQQSGGKIEPADERLRGDVVVDALLGTGLDRPVRDDYARLIAHINDAGHPVLAIDVPSGLSADTGTPRGVSVRADVTVSFIGRKRGLYTGQAGRWCGERVFDDLDVPKAIYDSVEPDAELLDRSRLVQWLPPRAPDMHKGNLGTVLVVGGNEGMAGAPVLAAQAALRTGSGLVHVATRAAHATVAASVQLEIMGHGVEELDELMPLLKATDVIALGPGLGRNDWASAIWRRVLASDKPLVLDADGLNLLADSPMQRGDWILTPHPGEAARLLGIEVPEVQADRFAAVRELAERFGATVVLKGHGTLIADPQGRVAVCAFGNPAMASAGMGDALTGIIVSLRGQGLAEFDAACCGVLVHALAGDRAAAGRRQILASDLIDALDGVLPA
jgi:ADP-dependent NAD(P)H-hydrate dehydratase / NAD(P)H-hydrate epimerase